MGCPKLVWEPQVGPQSFAFYDCQDIDELMFGGARGGGKTSYLLGDYGATTGEYGWRSQGVLFRRTYKQLEEVIRQGKQMFEKSGLAVYKKQERIFDFRNGAVLKLRHLDRLDDCEEYMGHEYTWIGFDEITNFKDFRIFEQMRACARNPWRNIKSILRYSGNPGGRLHNEVKAYFVDPAPLGKKVITNKAGKKRIFVPSKVTDNLILMQNDPDYVKYLESITDDALRAAWLDGSWDVALGSFFGDIFRRDLHVIPRIKSSDLPSHWSKYRAYDWGSAKPFCFLWYTIARDDIEINGKYFPNGSIIFFREYYGMKEGQFDTGLYMTSIEQAKAARKMEIYNGEQFTMRPGPADPAIWRVEHDGVSIYDMMSREGMYFDRADNARVTGWEQLRIRLKGYEAPLIYFTEDCIAIIRTLPVLARDEKKWDDVETNQEDHPSDVVRYVCMRYPMKPLPKEMAHLYGQSLDGDDEEVLDPIYG